MTMDLILMTGLTLCIYIFTCMKSTVVHRAVLYNRNGNTKTRIVHVYTNQPRIIQLYEISASKCGKNYKIKFSWQRALICRTTALWKKFLFRHNIFSELQFYSSVHFILCLCVFHVGHRSHWFKITMHENCLSFMISI